MPSASAKPQWTAKSRDNLEATLPLVATALDALGGQLPKELAPLFYRLADIHEANSKEHDRVRHAQLPGTRSFSIAEILSDQPEVDGLTAEQRKQLKDDITACSAHTTCQTIALVDEFRGSWFHPGLTRMTTTNKVYAADLKSDSALYEIPGRAGVCVKLFPTTKSHSPGIISMFCEHGFPVGFWFLQSAESPSHIFHIIMERWGVAPSLIVYDNICHLHKYCMAREPGFFRNTLMLVDRLHGPNHVNCSCAYRMSSRYEESVKKFNSQGAEQNNSVVNRIKTQLSYMLFNNASAFLRHHMTMFSDNKLANILKAAAQSRSSKKMRYTLAEIERIRRHAEVLNACRESPLIRTALMAAIALPASSSSSLSPSSSSASSAVLSAFPGAEDDAAELEEVYAEFDELAVSSSEQQDGAVVVDSSLYAGADEEEEAGELGRINDDSLAAFHLLLLESSSTQSS